MRNPALSNSLVDLAFRIKAEHEASTEFARRSLVHAMAAGDLLLEAKQQLKHGQWMPWLKEHCAIPDRTARLYMRLAENREQIGNGIANLSIQGAIRLLAEADRLADYEKIFRQLEERCWSKIGLGNQILDDFKKTQSKELAQKSTDNYADLFVLCFLMRQTCLKLRCHEALGLTEDQYLEQLDAPLREIKNSEDSDLGSWLYEQMKEWHAAGIDYEASVEKALAEAA